MPDRYYLSLFHHQHGVSAAVIRGSAADHWRYSDDHDPDDASEWFDEIALEPVFASAPDLLASLRSIRDALAELDAGWRGMDATRVDELIAGRLHIAEAAIAKAEGRDK
jgi:hypothetical protein